MMFAHVAGVPVEETLAAFGPVLAVSVSACVAWLRARGSSKHGRSD